MEIRNAAKFSTVKENTGNFVDKTITCSDCGQEFTLSAGEQQFFATKGLFEPKRCPLCRQKRKAEKANEVK